MTINAEQLRDELPSFLDRVAHGQQITITRDGVDVARLVPVETRHKTRLPWTLEEMRAFRAGNKLNGITIQELIAEGRKC